MGLFSLLALRAPQSWRKRYRRLRPIAPNAQRIVLSGLMGEEVFLLDVIWTCAQFLVEYPNQLVVYIVLSGTAVLISGALTRTSGRLLVADIHALRDNIVRHARDAPP